VSPIWVPQHEISHLAEKKKELENKIREKDKKINELEDKRVEEIKLRDRQKIE